MTPTPNDAPSADAVAALVVAWYELVAESGAGWPNNAQDVAESERIHGNSLAAALSAVQAQREALEADLHTTTVLAGSLERTIASMTITQRELQAQCDANGRPISKEVLDAIEDATDALESEATVMLNRLRNGQLPGEEADAQAAVDDSDGKVQHLRAFLESARAHRAAIDAAMPPEGSQP